MAEKKTVCGNPLVSNLAEMTRNAIRQTNENIAAGETEKTGNDWITFKKILDNGTEQHRGKGKMIWIDEDLKREIDTLKVSGLDIATRHIINAIVRAFLVEYRDRMKKL